MSQSARQTASWFSQNRKSPNANFADLRMIRIKFRKLAKFGLSRHSRSKALGLSSDNEKAITLLLSNPHGA
jgi:hypothetical protein